MRIKAARTFAGCPTDGFQQIKHWRVEQGHVTAGKC